MAIGPIDYSALQQSPDFLQSFTQGLQAGNALQNIIAQREANEQAKKNAEQYNTDIASAMQNPTPQAFASLALKYPQQREAFKQSWDQLDSSEKKSQGEAALQTAFALQNNNVDAAKKIINDRITALNNSGMDSSNEKNILNAIDTNPDMVKGQLLQWAAFTQDPAKFAENFGKLGAEKRAQDAAPSELAKSQAEATIKQAEAQTAPEKYKLELEQKGWDVKKLEEDIRSSKENTKLRALEVALSKERNQISRDDLSQKIKESNDKLAEKLRERVSTAENAAASIDNLSNTVDRILKNPSLDSVVGSLQGRAPAFISDEASNAIALIEQLGSQAFIAQIPQLKGTGSLSEKEGDKLQASLQNLSRVQGEKQFKENLQEVQRLVSKARDRLSKSTGVPLGGPDRPNAPAKSSDFGSGANQNSQQKNIVVDF